MYDGEEYIDPGVYPSFLSGVQAQDVRDPYIVARDVANAIVTPILDDNGNKIVEDVSYPDLLDAQDALYIFLTQPQMLLSSLCLFIRMGGLFTCHLGILGDLNIDNFLSYLESVIISSSTKLLAQPTLLVQEGETAVVRSGQSVITGVNKSEVPMDQHPLVTPGKMLALRWPGGRKD